MAVARDEGDCGGALPLPEDVRPLEGLLRLNLGTTGAHPSTSFTFSCHMLRTDLKPPGFFASPLGGLDPSDMAASSAAVAECPGVF